MKEAKDQKPVVDKLNELSSSLLDLIPWHHREGLDKIVTEDNERYRSVCDAITKQVDQINADLLKSQQVNQILLIFSFLSVVFFATVVISMFSNEEVKCVHQFPMSFFRPQFEQAADTELSWLNEAERKLLSMGEIRLGQDQTTAQLQTQKVRSYSVCMCIDTGLHFKKSTVNKAVSL